MEVWVSFCHCTIYPSGDVYHPMEALLISNTKFRLEQFIKFYKDYIATFTKITIHKSSAKYSDNTDKNSKAFVDPSMLENITNSLKMELNRFTKLLLTLEKWLHISSPQLNEPCLFFFKNKNKNIT